MEDSRFVEENEREASDASALLCDLCVGTADTGMSTCCKACARKSGTHLSVPKTGASTDSKTPAAFDEAKLPEVENERILCDLYLGTTGSGKSTYCKARSRAEDKLLFVPNHSAGSGTHRPVIGRASVGRLLLLDTQGLQDTSGKEDSDIRVELLQKIYDAGVDSVRIVWCVLPNAKATTELQKQAAFIVSLLPETEDATEFWANSVLIVVKNDTEAESRMGAIEAAVRNGADKLRINAQSVKILDLVRDKRMKRFFESWTNEERFCEGVVRQTELESFQETKLCEVRYCRLVKRDDCCVNCGMTGDKRLWRHNCHGLPFERVHIGSYRGYGHELADEELTRLVKIAVPMRGVIGGLEALALSAVGGELSAVGTASACVAGVSGGLVLGAGVTVAALGALKVTDSLTSRWTCCNAKYAEDAPCTTRCSTCGALKGMRDEETEAKCSSAHFVIAI